VNTKVDSNALNESIRNIKQLMSALLTSDDLAEWTGFSQAAKQMEWLRENHIPYRLNRLGKPITTLEAVNASLLDRKVADEVAF
jgi:hypothetical protein